MNKVLQDDLDEIFKDFEKVEEYYRNPMTCTFPRSLKKKFKEE